LIPGREKKRIFLYATASRLALGPTQPPNQWELGFLSPELNQPGHEDDHCHQTNAEVKNAWNYTSMSPYILMEW